MAQTGNFLNRKRRPRPALVVALVLGHLLVLYGLAKALAPDFTGEIEDSVVSTFTVTVTAPPDPPEPPPAPPQPDEGAQGDPGKRATPKPTTAPVVNRPSPKPAPRATSTGRANTSGARESGEGTGAAGTGDGTGSGRGGSGTGNGVAVKPSVRSGELNTASDFPVPDGGRQSRFGKSVTVVFTVQPDGRATNCSVARSGVDAQTTARVCPLVMEKIRFNPATTADGRAVPARYGYRVDFNAR